MEQPTPWSEREPEFLEDTWLRIPYSPWGIEVTADYSTEPFERKTNNDSLPGTYNINNGTLFVHTNSGAQYVTKATPETMSVINKYQYRQDTNMFVPFSNSELPTDPSLKAQWENIKKRA